MADEMPRIDKYSVGDCEMLPHQNGAWMQTAKLRQLIDWVTDDDSWEVMLDKLIRIRDAVS